ncbi:hypothetical protein [Belnapia moabensis]|uniref:hypothetical protein n=1 Tax=Belnapia moabensis TaxID=365533 RepID=UPI0005BB6963|nr:hypothetical protein [Belnapia moabensis]
MRTYPDKDTFDRELDRLTGLCVQFKVRAQAQGVEIETVLHRTAAEGEIDPEDYEMVRLPLGATGARNFRHSCVDGPAGYAAELCPSTKGVPRYAGMCRPSAASGAWR